MRIPIHRLIFSPTMARRAKAARKGYYGLCFMQDRVILLDPRAPNVPRTLFHELLHLMNPKWSEAHVRREERKRWALLTWKDKARLYQALGKGVYE